MAHFPKIDIEQSTSTQSNQHVQEQMQMIKYSYARGVFTGILVGLLIGTIIAVLFLVFKKKSTELALALFFVFLVQTPLLVYLFFPKNRRL
jgi:uncharacterized integral membrane protein